MEKINGRIETVSPQSQNLKDEELSKGDFVVISDSLQDVIIPQNESQMKAARGKNVNVIKISLLKAFQINKEETKSLAVPTSMMDDEFKELLDLNKTAYAKAEHIKSKKEGRVLQMCIILR